MKVLICGEGVFFAIAPQLKKALERLGCSADIFDWTEQLYTARGHTLKNRILNRLLRPAVSARINSEFLRAVKKDRYDLVIVNNGWHLTAPTIDEVKKNAGHVVLWSTDELYNKVFSSFIHPDSYPRYDCVFSQRRHLFDSYRAKGLEKLEYLPLFYYPEHHPVTTSEEEKKTWGSDIAFMGTWSKEREKMIDALSGLNVRIWGGYWQKSSREFREKFTITSKIAWLEDMSRVVNSTKIIIDALTKEQHDQINMKNLQIPACGGFLITSKTDKIVEMFAEDREVVCYETYGELRRKCEYYLLHEDERRAIASRAHEKVTGGPNSILDVAKTILAVAGALR